MEKVIYKDSWGEFFAEFGLASLGDFFEYSPVETIGINNKRSVVTFGVGSDSQRQQFFMKRFLHPHFKDMFFAWRNFGRFCSQARCEWENARLLLDNGIETYRPVCYGERTKFGVENKSFMITQKLPGRALTDFVRDEWHDLASQQKRDIIAGIGAFVRRIHALNVSLPDLYVWHIFIRENPANGGWEFAVIDLHRMSPNVTDEHTRIKNLGRLYHSMIESYFDEELKRLFIEAYAGDNWHGDIERLAARVKKQSDAVSAKRRPKPY